MERSTALEPGDDEEPQLYGLARDIGERRNVAAEHPAEVRGLSDLLATIRREERTRAQFSFTEMSLETPGSSIVTP